MAVVVTAGATTQYINNAFTSGTVTVSNLNGGSTFGTGKVVVGFGCNDATTPTAPQIGGVAMTAAIAEAGNKVQLWYADVSAGTADTFTFTNGAAFGAIAVGAWFLAGATTGVPSHTATNTFGNSSEPITTAMTVDSNGGGVCFCYQYDGAAATLSVNWTSTTAGPAWGSSALLGGAGGSFSTTPGSISFAVSHATGIGLDFEAGLALASWGAPSLDTLQPQIWM